MHFETATIFRQLTTLLEDTGFRVLKIIMIVRKNKDIPKIFQNVQEIRESKVILVLRQKDGQIMMALNKKFYIIDNSFMK
jgi:hypothetical protein